jgi:iron transport multicopper oxidase
MAMSSKPDAEIRQSPAEMDGNKRSFVTKKRCLLFVGAVVIVLGLALGLGLGIGLRNGGNSEDPLQSTKTPVSWRRDPQEYVLSSSFDIHAPNTTRTYTLNLTEIPNGAPDGVSRRLLLINGAFPGPAIEANEGDRLVVHVNNLMTIPSAIHWHGQYQNGAFSA